MSKNLKIGIDIDNVIADSYPSFLSRFNKIFGTKISYEEISDFYYLEKYSGIGLSDVKKFIDKHLADEIFQINIPPQMGAMEVIKKWGKMGHKIHYITSRPKNIREITLKWLSKHGFFLPDSTLDIFDSEKHYDTHRGQIISYKKTAAIKRGVNLFIEDSKEIALAMGVPVYLFNRPWNKGKLPKHIKRVKNWREIEELLNKESYALERLSARISVKSIRS